MVEERITNDVTGGQKGRKSARTELMPVRPLLTIAEVYGFGASKYEDRNWEKGYDWSLSYGALLRHEYLWWSGEDIDPESGLPHLAHAGFHIYGLLEFAETHPELDDRPKRPRPGA